MTSFASETVFCGLTLRDGVIVETVKAQLVILDNCAFFVRELCFEIGALHE